MLLKNGADPLTVNAWVQGDEDWIIRQTTFTTLTTLLWQRVERHVVGGRGRGKDMDPIARCALLLLGAPSNHHAHVLLEELMPYNSPKQEKEILIIMRELQDAAGTL